MKFSVLMSIYHKENPEYFNCSIQSIYDEQSIKPDEIVLVQDGPLNDELYQAIDEWKDRLKDVLKVIPLEKNVGLGDALDIGIQNCTHELIARMDTDDISLPQRFEKQLKVFKNNDIDICSSWVSEFDKDENKIISYRKLPKNNDEIVKFAKYRNPINHPAVMYKKSAVEKAGGYKKMILFEDYYLWIRMIVKGASFYNIQEPLLHMRAGYEQLERRSGLAYAKNEIKLLKEFRQIGFLTSRDFLKNILLKIPIRLMPLFIVKRVYKLLRKKDK